MELSRRDAIGALAAIGVGTGAAAYAVDTGGDAATAPVETLVAVAEVVYPSELSGVEPFVETFAERRAAGDDDHARGVRAAVDTAAEVPDGSTAERVRYYVVNDLLMALYASPTGGELVGLENPRGHPGGTDSYQRGPRQ
ncbi:hypothetical protein BRC99_00075 [Halobacteriales archaeon QS_7_69_60]|nr:MAG: hypothetical protein BRC99_00075 [Halobacteriales archaeon QS_7_69_60]